jgi:hypothetical protein
LLLLCPLAQLSQDTIFGKNPNQTSNILGLGPFSRVYDPRSTAKSNPLTLQSLSRRGGPSSLGVAHTRTSSASWPLLGGEFEGEGSSCGYSEGFSAGVEDDIDEEFSGRNCRSLFVE